MKPVLGLRTFERSCQRTGDWMGQSGSGSRSTAAAG